MRLTFYGVRGSTPSPSEENRRYGGNTSSVVIDIPGEKPIMLDLGTGTRLWGIRNNGHLLDATALVTHLHWDHIQGLPFFGPADRDGCRLRIHAPGQNDAELADAIAGWIRPPYHPITLAELGGTIELSAVASTDFEIGSARVMARPVPHRGATVGYRLEWQGKVVTYISDHQAPPERDSVADSVLELCHNADVLIHDAQYTDDEFVKRANWGHSTLDYACLVAQKAGAKRLYLYHHDPGHSDDELERLHADLRARAPAGLEVVGAREGMEVTLE